MLTSETSYSAVFYKKMIQIQLLLLSIQTATYLYYLKTQVLIIEHNKTFKNGSVSPFLFYSNNLPFQKTIWEDTFVFVPRYPVD